MELRPYQKEAKAAILNEWREGRDKTLLVLPTGCHEPCQGILMFSGKVKKASEIKEGMLLMGPDGGPRRVLKVHHGRDEMFCVTPVKGKPFVVNSRHLLPFAKTNEKKKPAYPSQAGGRIECATPTEWIQKSKYWKHTHKLYRSNAIECFNGTKSITVDPYFLGILLGDGEMKHGIINITTPDKEIVEEIRRQAFRYEMTVKGKPAGKAKTYYLQSGAIGCKGGKLHSELKALGVVGKGAAEKAVPFDYKTAPIETRKEIVAGLLDSDGSLAGNGYDFISKSKQLSEDLAFMARSLGLAAYVHKATKTIKSTGFSGTYWRVSISGDTSAIPCRVKRKQAIARGQKKDVLRTGIKSIEPAGVEEYCGFTVNGDNLYLMDDFTVTHNCGKTIVFGSVAAERAAAGKVLVLAHREELLTQAADKIRDMCGIECAVEKAERTSIGTDALITVGSVQTMMSERRLNRFASDHFKTVIVDEAHHVLADSYQNVLNHFGGAKVLGVTATPDRGDMRNLGQYFESLAYEYNLRDAINQGYLCKIRVETIPLEIDFSRVKVSRGDFQLDDVGHALEPYLHDIAAAMARSCKGRHTVVFLPLVRISQQFRDILLNMGIRAAEVNGNSSDREEVLSDFAIGKYDVLCNSMLLTEGWDCPIVDCIVVLRPTKIRSLYCQMVGRGTRLHPGKDGLLILDFLWMTGKHNLIHPADIICEDSEKAKEITERLAEKSEEWSGGNGEDLFETERDVNEERRRALAKALEEAAAARRKKKLVDPIEFELAIGDDALIDYVPSFGWEMEEATVRQVAYLERMQIDASGMCKGKASKLIDKLATRRSLGLCTPKQARLLQRRGFRNPYMWQFDEASSMISRLAAVDWQPWRLPFKPSEYVPQSLATEDSEWS